MRIIVVDDNEQNRYMLQVLLEGHGYQVVSTGDGAEALKVARRDPPDMIISDILMPVMDGFSLCRECKKDAGLKAVPFVFYTATYTDPKDKEFALSLGAERFIIKPQEPDVFMELVQEVLDNYETDRLAALGEPVEEEVVFFRGHNDALIRKLEDKLAQLEETNQALEREIARRKQVEEALRDSEGKFRNIVESSPLGVHMYELQAEQCLVFVGANPAADVILGVANATFIGKTIEEAFPALADTQVPVRYREAAAHGTPWRTEQIEYDEGGIKGAFEVIAFQTAPGAMVAMFHDITERARTEEALRQSEALLNATQRLTKVGGWEMDVENQTMFWTEETYRIHGFLPDEIETGSTAHIERSLACYSPKDRPVIAEAFQECVEEGQPYDLEFPFTTVQGRQIWIRTTARPVVDAKGSARRVVKVIGNIMDITERKQAEEELKLYRDHLEDLVRERTRELEAVQVELVRKERLSALGKLTATVAHEIRNPLGTVRSAVFAIGDALEREQPARVEPALQLAERNIVRCDNIINELLDYSRDRTLQLQPTRIDTWLETLLDEQAIPQDIVCVHELACGLQVPIDREHLRRAVVNVVENAVQALQEQSSPEKQLTVSTSIAVDGSRLEIEFRDTGPGIPDDVLPRVFEPLFSTKSFGIGLGLSIVKNIMEQHRGGVSLQSVAANGGQPGGTSVVLWLPVDREAPK